MGVTQEADQSPDVLRSRRQEELLTNKLQPPQKQALLGVIVVLVLVAFAGIGIAHIFKPDYFTNRSGVRRRGELLTEWNRLGFQIVGTVFATFAIYLLFVFFRG